MISSLNHACDDCNRRLGALLLRVSVGDYPPHRKTEWNPPTEAWGHRRFGYIGGIAAYVVIDIENC